MIFEKFVGIVGGLAATIICGAQRAHVQPFNHTLDEAYRMPVGQSVL